ncbi:uncharacterized protein LAESUDRAFT_763021 [Laetiporus sulphureus 93-53]|uniref:Mid2 domain-containing protein n=1 Tax=Laetiporus sulphureus 93-53 TaxID=1314785 RepID=A0A165C620_9APHY|nr:uncharacterized protein LAESUDRAFT_763021 [Laetiporus sulphureus 93-53]KZT02265.1 hypothetical protein LAESUDRAFT_763021 [Laetiporus sulphureus 93-53]
MGCAANVCAVAVAAGDTPSFVSTNDVFQRSIHDDLSPAFLGLIPPGLMLRSLVRLFLFAFLSVLVLASAHDVRSIARRDGVSNILGDVTSANNAATTSSSEAAQASNAATTSSENAGQTTTSSNNQQTTSQQTTKTSNASPTQTATGGNNGGGNSQNTASTTQAASGGQQTSQSSQTDNSGGQQTTQNSATATPTGGDGQQASQTAGPPSPTPTPVVVVSSIASTSLSTNAQGQTQTEVVTVAVSVTLSSASTSATSGGGSDGNSSVNTGTIVGLSVAGGVALIGVVAFAIFKFSRKKYLDEYDDGEAIKWPELGTHGESPHALPTHRTGGAGFDTSSEVNLVARPDSRAGSIAPSAAASTVDLYGVPHDPYAVPPLPHLNPNVVTGTGAGGAQPYHDDPSSGYYDPYNGPVPHTLEGEAIPMTQIGGSRARSPGPAMAMSMGMGGRASPAPPGGMGMGMGGRASPAPGMGMGGRASPAPSMGMSGRASPGPQMAMGGRAPSPGPGAAYGTGGYAA